MSKTAEPLGVPMVSRRRNLRAVVEAFYSCSRVVKIFCAHDAMDVTVTAGENAMVTEDRQATKRQTVQRTSHG